MNHLKTHWKLFGICIGIGLVAALGLRAAFAPEPAATKSPPPESSAPKPDSGGSGTGLLVDLGNTICPINEGEVDGTTTVEWNHVRVSFCCPGCDTKFLRDPEGALDKAGIEWKDLGDAIARFQKAPADHKQHQLDAIRKRWTVIREP